MGAVALAAEPVLAVVATLEVVPVGGWAEVLVDGLSLGLGPVTTELAPGKHVIELAETGHHFPSSRVVWLAPGERLEVTMPRTLKPGWLEPRGYPAGTWVQVDGGPGPHLQAGTKIAIADGLVHEFQFRLGVTVLQEVALQRCLESGCLLPGDVRVLEWQQRGAEPLDAPPLNR